MRNLLSLFILLVIFVSCQEKKKNLSFYDADSVEINSTEFAQEETPLENNTTNSSDIIQVPFFERNGVKFVEVKINRTIGVNMILDSGCSTTLISVDEANYLYRKGVFGPEDIKGFTQSQIADGSIVENMVINLKEVVIGDKIVCPNVEAVVSSNSVAPLLLGNEVLNRTASYTVDNKNKVINFNLQTNE